MSERKKKKKKEKEISRLDCTYSSLWIEMRGVREGRRRVKGRWEGETCGEFLSTNDLPILQYPPIR